jgi:hypothetical protein
MVGMLASEMVASKAVEMVGPKVVMKGIMTVALSD